MNPQRRLLWGLCAFAAIIVAGTGGYMVVEGWSFLDALYMTVITITTVGYAEIHSLSAGGRIFGIFLIIGGVGGALYAVTGIIGYILEGHFGTTLGRRRMKNRIAKLRGHFILCGFGRVGGEIARTFKEEGVPFVVIDNRPDCIARAEQAGYLCLLGDATSDEMLREAGIERARGLVSAIGDDVANTYITLSARGLCPDLFIEARASSEETETKLKRAGADRVVSANSIGARRMAMLALRPAVVDFIYTVIYGRGRELEMENVAIGSNSPLVDQTIEAIRNQTKAAILAISKKGGKPLANPPSDRVIEVGDRLIIIGTKEQLKGLERLCEGGQSQ